MPHIVLKIHLVYSKCVLYLYLFCLLRIFEERIRGRVDKCTVLLFLQFVVFGDIMLFARFTIIIKIIKLGKDKYRHKACIQCFDSYIYMYYIYVFCTVLYVY